MKKKIFIKTISFLLLFFFLILIYLWTYIFPSIRKVNILKREIKEYTLRIKNAEIEKYVFVAGDNREELLFTECDYEFEKRLENWKNNAITFEDVLRNRGEKAGVSRLSISEAPGENISFSDHGTRWIMRNMVDLDFIAGLRYGAEFLKVLPFAGQYMLINTIQADRTGAYYHFNVTAEHLTLSDDEPVPDNSPENRKSDLIDMNSPILKKPVYLSPLKIRKTNAESGRSGQ